MSVYSTYSSSAHTFSYDHRRSSVNSMIRGPPHKSNMQIVLPQPLAPTAAGNGLPGSTGGNYNDAEDSALRRNQRRHSRVDMWTETNNIARSKSPLVPLADLAADGSRERNRRPSQGSEKSGRSLELPNGGHFQHMQPPPPLPAASSRSFLTSSRSGTPTSSSSALPPMSSAMTTPQRSMGSSELVLEKPPSPSDAQSTSTSSNAAPADADSKPPPQQPQNDVKPDNLPIIPSSQPIETK
ncbi:hypothetical protein FRC01_010172 [Tulasnella sp. 417]|nr:hypothetical protein FRC01_010172 [Tulasnella sp. 417]